MLIVHKIVFSGYRNNVKNQISALWGLIGPTLVPYRAHLPQSGLDKAGYGK